MKVLITWLYFLALCAGVSAQTTAKGTVFIDDNGNGKKERKEAGLPNVAVSNGSEVVLTDEEGAYTLPVGDDAMIFVIKPSGYRTPSNPANIPQFFYNHKPEGSPKAAFAGVEPSGKLPRSVDFGLIPQQEKDDFTALIFGDPQPRNLEEVAYFRRGIIEELEGINEVSFGISLGDLVWNDLELFGPYIDAVKKVGIPWYNVMGNHDMNLDATADEFSDETFEAHFGPATYAFNYGKAHFIILDDILFPDPRDAQGYWGGFSKKQLEFIANDLKFVPKDRLIVLAFHIPISEPGGDSFRDEDREQLFHLLEDYPHTLSLSAHTHIQRQDFLGKDSGWPGTKQHHHYNVGTTCGDWHSGTLDENGIPVSVMRDGTPKGYAFIHFDGNEYRIKYKVAGKAEDYQISIFSPKVVAHGQNTKAGIYANFFIGGEKDTVEYRVDDGSWKPMHYLEDYDPSYVARIMEWDQSEELLKGRRSSNPVDSKHLWRGDIPTNLETGTHRIEVRATDMYGQTYTASSVYRLEKQD